MRRVVVKSRIVRHAGRRYTAAPLTVHIAYLEREGVDRARGRGRVFGADGDADGRDFAARCAGDRHHFRFIVSPEDAGELADLRAFARDLMGRAEADLGTPLDWIGVEHWNTGHPHLHLLVRGVDPDGADLVIAGDYLTRGLRGRAEALASLELGPRSSREIAAALQREVEAERWTGLDRTLEALASADRVDLRPGPGAPDREILPQLVGRARTLERLGLATAEAPGVWRLAADRRERLRGLGERGDIIAALNRATGGARSPADLRLAGEETDGPLLGRVLERGLHDELSGEAYVIVDGVDGRAHHVRFRDLAAAGDTPVGGVVEVRPGPDGVVLVHRSDLAVAAQVKAEGATWLDRQLLAREPAALAERGFGGDVRAALEGRRAHLAGLGLARPGPRGLTFAADLLATLRARELAAAAARLERETGWRRLGDDDPVVRGRYVRRLALASGRFALVEQNGGFRLAPWARALDRRLGQEVSGRLGPGGMVWDLGRGLGR